MVVVLIANGMDFLVNYHLMDIVPEAFGFQTVRNLVDIFILAVPLIYGVPKKLGSFQYFFAGMFVLESAVTNLGSISELEAVIAILLSVITLGVIYFLGTNKNLTR